jgi:hypothetical protein
VVGIGAALLAVMLVVVLRPAATPPDVRGRVVAVQVGRADVLKVTLEVDKPPLAEAECSVSAFDDKSFNVGRLVKIVVGPRRDDVRLNELHVNIPTDHAAVTARVTACTITRDH